MLGGHAPIWLREHLNSIEPKLVWVSCVDLSPQQVPQVAKIAPNRLMVNLFVRATFLAHFADEETVCPIVCLSGRFLSEGIPWSLIVIVTS